MACGVATRFIPTGLLVQNAGSLGGHVVPLSDRRPLLGRDIHVESVVVKMVAVASMLV